MKFVCSGVLGLALVAFACGPRTTSMECAPYARPEELTQRASPYDSVEVVSAGIRAKVCYSRPSVNGPVVLGDLVRWDTL